MLVVLIVLVMDTKMVLSLIPICNLNAISKKIPKTNVTEPTNIEIFKYFVGSMSFLITWDNIKNKPTTVSGYKITDVYTKEEVDQRLKNISSSGDGVVVDTVSWYKVLDTPTTISGYGITDVYTKAEIDTMISTADISIDEDELNAMLAEILG